ncbi:MAG TPA: hypothetical protein VIH86_16440 [Puia sp.]|jgi:hypothetical protein
MIHTDTSAKNESHKSPFLLSIIVKIFIFINLFSSECLFAQEMHKLADTTAKVLLSEQQWKDVEGIFQDPQNNDRAVQFTARENFLVAKLLWNNAEIQFIPESAFAFVSKEPVEDVLLHIVFKKDSTGAIDDVNLAKIGVWKRNKNYKLVVKKEMDHTPDQLKPFEGLYQLQNHDDRFIQFIVKGNNLVLKQYWDGNEISFVPETPLDFFSKEVPLFSLSFSKDKDGNITQALAFKQDLWIKTKKIILSAEQLKPYEGKFRSKDDPDNYVQIMAKNNNLIVKQLWDGKEITVEPQTETYFYNEAQSFPLQIAKGKDGNITQVWILGIDEFDKVK